MELFGLCWKDGHRTEPLGHPVGMGYLALRLLPQTKAARPRPADVLVAYTTATGLSVGVWLHHLRTNLPALDLAPPSETPLFPDRQYFSWSRAIFFFACTTMRRGVMFFLSGTLRARLRGNSWVPWLSRRPRSGGRPALMETPSGRPPLRCRLSGGVRHESSLRAGVRLHLNPPDFYVSCLTSSNLTSWT
jgi:hypothetical protein